MIAKLMSGQSVLVTGGAGYIGSHMVKMLRCAGYSVCVVDDLSSGFDRALLGAEFIRGSIGDAALLNEVFASYDVGAVMHFAGSSVVSESTQKPDLYYQNNVSNTLVLLDVMRTNGVDKLIFSSTAAIFGGQGEMPISESAHKNPMNPYGRSKWMVEQILADYDFAYSIKSVCLRYFNAAGADPEGGLGECHEPETHLIPLVLQVASGRRKSVSIFGNDYPTEDGTCIRDYVHVADLCSAHLLSLEFIVNGGQSARYNLGNGQGYSILEVIKAVERVTGQKIPREFAPRRLGDSPVLVADSTVIKRDLGWSPRYQNLDDIVQHAWIWERRLALGCAL